MRIDADMMFDRLIALRTQSELAARQVARSLRHRFPELRSREDAIGPLYGSIRSRIDNVPASICFPGDSY